jgi:flagellar assembly protein FliH
MPLPSEVATPIVFPGGKPGAVSRVFPADEENIEVARLVFESVEELDARNGRLSERAEIAAALQEQVAALEGKLRSQVVALPGQLEEARWQSRLQARKEWEEELQQRVTEDRAKLKRACDAFDQERARYFSAVEAQVVKLALAIARQVMHREAKIDPMLLAAAVRVALEKVEHESEITLRVAAGEAQMWSGLFKAENNSAINVVGDDAMAAGECTLETSVGSVELGIEAQLAEIERGFFDLLEKRPA